MSDARERRRQRATESSKESQSAGSVLKKYRVPIVIVILWAAIVAYNVTAADNAESCPGHWHSTMTVFVEGERVLFTPNPDYTLEGGTMPVKTHMHQGSESLWHFEPNQKECVAYEDALRRVDMDIGPGVLELDGDYHMERGWGGTHASNDTHSVSAWMKEWEGEWESISLSKLDDMQVPDGSQVLLVYGDEDDDGIVALQEQAQPIPGNQVPGEETGPTFPWGPVLGVSAFAVVGLLVWRSVTKNIA